MIGTEELDEHFDILKEIFQRLVENKLELRQDKCEFLKSSIDYLGYTVTGKGIKANESGVEAVKLFLVPTKVHELQSFISLCSYFRRFVQDFSLIAKPLYDLTRKNTKFVFGEKELQAFT